MLGNTWGQSPRVGAAAIAIILLWAGCSSPATQPDSTSSVSRVQADPVMPENVMLYVVDSEGRTVVVASENRIIRDLNVNSANVLLDSTAQWLAYANFSPTGSAKTVFAGPVGGPYEPIATGISSFRWHEARPGLLALQQRHRGANAGQRTIQIADFTETPPTMAAPQVVASDGALQRFGDWGFAFDLGGNVFQSTIVDLQGEAVAQRLDGFVAPIGEDQLLLIGYVAEARLLSTESGSTRDIDWFSVGDTVMESVTLSDGSVAFAMSNSFTTARRLMIVNQTGAVLDIGVDGLLAAVASSSFGPWPITIRRSGTEGVVERWRPSADSDDTSQPFYPEEIGRIDSLDLTTARPLILLSGDA